MTIARIRETRSAPQETRSYSADQYLAAGVVPPASLRSVSRAGQQVTETTSLQMDTVYLALRVISNAIIDMEDLQAYTRAYSSTNGKAYRKWEVEQPQLLQNPWANMFWYDGLDRTVFSLGLHGEAFWLTILRDDDGNPEVLEVLNPRQVTRKVENGQVAYSYTSGSQTTQLAAEDVTWIPFKAMPGQLKGLSAIEYNSTPIALALAAYEYGAAWFANGASPGWLLTNEQTMDRQDAKALIKQFEVEHAGASNAHRPLLLDGGVQAQQLNATPDNAQYLQTLEYAKQTVASWFGLPSHFVGGATDKGNVWGANAEEVNTNIVLWTLSGYIRPIEQAMSSLLPGDLRAGFDSEPLIRPSSVNAAALATSVRNGSGSANDVRTRILGWEPSADPKADLLTALPSNQSAESQEAQGQVEASSHADAKADAVFPDGSDS